MCGRCLTLAIGLQGSATQRSARVAKDAVRAARLARANSLAVRSHCRRVTARPKRARRARRHRASAKMMMRTTRTAILDPSRRRSIRGPSKGSFASSCGPSRRNSSLSCRPSTVRIAARAAVGPPFTPRVLLSFRFAVANDSGTPMQRLVCPIPGCAKTFLNIDGIIYHGKSTVHDVMETLGKVYPADVVGRFTRDDLPRAVRTVWRVHAFDKSTRFVPFTIGFPKARKADRRSAGKARAVSPEGSVDAVGRRAGASAGAAGAVAAAAGTPTDRRRSDAYGKVRACRPSLAWLRR